ncbi:MAG: hypothetical protein CM1200mP20_17270 [Pseudomonadota bacterium]|nr:MAG: hypothetical protein CM1200mP20_17270 [Pseudomonadota bacterium]
MTRRRRSSSRKQRKLTRCFRPAEASAYDQFGHAVSTPPGPGAGPGSGVRRYFGDIFGDIFGGAAGRPGALPGAVTPVKMELSLGKCVAASKTGFGFPPWCVAIPAAARGLNPGLPDGLFHLWRQGAGADAAGLFFDSTDLSPVPRPRVDDLLTVQ